MPHPVPSAASPSRDDEELPDAPLEITTENGGVKLEDMFNDDDDEEFPASSAQEVKMESSPAPASATYAVSE